MPGKIQIAAAHPRNFVEETNRSTLSRNLSRQPRKRRRPRLMCHFGRVGLASETLAKGIELILLACVQWQSREMQKAIGSLRALGDEATLTNASPPTASD